MTEAARPAPPVAPAPLAALADADSLDAPKLIDLPTCVKGLTRELSTGLAGGNFLAYFGRVSRDRFTADLDQAASAAAVEFDRAPSSKKSLRLHNDLTGQLLLNAYGLTGRPYRAGGRLPQTGFDEAGLIQFVYGQEGLKLPPTAADQVAKGQAVAREELRPGDVLVYRLPKTGNYLLGLYSGNGNFILASSKLSVVTETAAFGTEYGPWFIGGRRYVDDPAAAPLSDELKTMAANGAVKLALSAMGDNIPKPTNIYGSTGKKSIKRSVKKPRRAATKRASSAKRSSKKR
ncbi:MAG: C40 family peptidase [Deltaproteobacteria bacterium]|nr:C40 family peptidase [Deltaproteobacteria bacterium]